MTSRESMRNISKFLAVSVHYFVKKYCSCEMHVLFVKKCENEMYNKVTKLVLTDSGMSIVKHKSSFITSMVVCIRQNTTTIITSQDIRHKNIYMCYNEVTAIKNTAQSGRIF